MRLSRRIVMAIDADVLRAHAIVCLETGGGRFDHARTALGGILVACRRCINPVADLAKKLIICDSVRF